MDLGKRKAKIQFTKIYTKAPKRQIHTVMCNLPTMNAMLKALTNGTNGMFCTTFDKTIINVKYDM